MNWPGASAISPQEEPCFEGNKPVVGSSRVKSKMDTQGHQPCLFFETWRTYLGSPTFCFGWGGVDQMWSRDRTRELVGSPEAG